MATHSSILAWRIPMDTGAWRATVHMIAKSQTPLKRLSTHVCTQCIYANPNLPIHCTSLPHMVSIHLSVSLFLLCK